MYENGLIVSPLNRPDIRVDVGFATDGVAFYVGPSHGSLIVLDSHGTFGDNGVNPNIFSQYDCSDAYRL